MSGFGAQHGDVDPGAPWRALSGDPLPEVPELSHPQPPPQHPWQDEHHPQAGTRWHYPYVGVQPPQTPPYAGAEQLVAQPHPHHHATPSPEQEAAPPTGGTVIPVEQLEPVGPPQYLAPARVVRDPRQRTMAAVITFIALLIGLWGILGFLGTLSTTLTSIASGNQKLKLQMNDANKGLADLDAKTANLVQMESDSARMKELLVNIDADMGTMLNGVNDIATGMESTSSSLNALDGELGKVGEINSSMAEKLGSINTGLASQVKQVRTMRRDVEATSRVLKTLPGRLTATNKRLEHVNNSVNTMGACGITNNLKVKINLGPIPNGSATVYATVIPPGAWGEKIPGKTPC